MKVYVDKTAPQITVTGIEEGGSYKGLDAEAKIKVSDGIRLAGFEVFADNEKIHETSNIKSLSKQEDVLLPEGLNQTIKIVAVDEAGNSDTYIIEDVTVSSNFFLRLWANKPLFLGLCALILAAAATGIFFYRKKRRSSGEAA